LSLSPAQLLTVIEAITDKVAAAGSLITYVIPSPLTYSDKASFFADLDDTKDTQDEIDAALIYALWIDYLRFEDSDREHDSPVKTIHFEFTVFHEQDAERIDENDTFETRILKSKQDHVADLMKLCIEFQGITPIDLGADFATVETISLIQPENTQRDVAASFFRSDVIGSQTKLECAVRVQTVAC
jgi:hypothetical protein